ncbi:transposase [Zooshikella marina]|uniref:transposase n=1 Tax=Zooshikella ganghwensis TaxID=202772 RepID=UPI001BAF8D7E|nr:transposase [Zooshikella ganghwensis]MBU2709371.1 transposase [Zooshikella ganghwensis]
MTRPRSELVSVADTPFYHCICRCVRRAFLCGDDRVTGQNFDHRKAWLVERLAELVKVFAIDICAYAVMSNHYHLVVRINEEKAAQWTDDEVIRRWRKLYQGPPMVQRYLAGAVLDKAELKVVNDIVQQWRIRLTDLSWFMRCLNEPIARWANDEDGCKGRFWEGRFKSQALLDEAALLTCMSYVDLNPVRAGMAETPEASDFTSIQARMIAWVKRQRKNKKQNKSFVRTTKLPKQTLPTVPLLRFSGNEKQGKPSTISFSSKDYLQLVDWLGRAIRDDKRGAIPSNMPPILARLNINHDELLTYVSKKEKRFIDVMGTENNFKKIAKQWQRKFIKGIRLAKQLFSRQAVYIPLTNHF